MITDIDIDLAEMADLGVKLTMAIVDKPFGSTAPITVEHTNLRNRAGDPYEPPRAVEITLTSTGDTSVPGGYTPTRFTIDGVDVDLTPKEDTPA